MPFSWSLWRNRWAVFCHDLCSIPIAWLGAYWLRFNLGVIPEEIFSEAINLLPWIVAFQMVGFWWFGLYRGVWRFASLPDLIRIVKAVSVGCLGILILGFFMTRLQFLPRSVIPLYGMILLCILGGSRFVYRWYKDKRTFSKRGERVLIVGAGHAAESLVRDLLRHPKNQFAPIALVDDDPKKQGRELHGIRVIGACHQIPDIVQRFSISTILIAVPSAKASDMRRIVALCEGTQKTVRTLPAMNDLVAGLVSVKNLREISLADLLGRDPVKLDWKAIEGDLSDKVVLVSGGGGSIGSELCRQVVALNPKKLIIMDNSEYNLFCIQEELRETYPDKVEKMFVELADICDNAQVNRIMRHFGVQIIFHAAAYKHVPLLEPQVRAAARNNILGTYTLAQAANWHKIEKFVLVSTDKAVNPTNVMGATKRIAEMICTAFNQHRQTRFITVRFGNVLGSRGSVVETFQRQLENGGPLTVTHPEVMRYFMTIKEASQLILQALAMGDGGELFVLDMGEPIKIRFMAEQMIKLAGKRKDEVKIEFVGLRSGEKLFEELVHKREKLLKTNHAKILKAQHREIEPISFEKQILRLQQAVLEDYEEEVFNLIKAFVPEFTHPEHLKMRLNGNQKPTGNVNVVPENISL